MKALATVCLILLALLGVFILIPSPIDAVAYQPNPAPALEGVLAPNTKLKNAELIGLGKVIGAEDVDVDAQGRVYGAALNGDIVRISGTEVEVMANTGGRPLGLEFDAGGNLIIADAISGLLSMNPNGELRVLATTADDRPFKFVDDVDVGPDGIIYFSDASDKFGLHDYKLDGLEARGHGRLIAYNPATGELNTLIDNINFANGVAVSPAGDFVLVNETFRYRVLRYWLSGPKQGQTDVFADNLPGFPDGISSNGQGTYWVALASPRNAQLDSLHPKPFLKELVAKLPDALQPKPEEYGFVLALDRDGAIIDSLQDPSGEHLHTVTSVEQAGDYIYFGTLTYDRIGRMKVQ